MQSLSVLQCILIFLLLFPCFGAAMPALVRQDECISNSSPFLLATRSHRSHFIKALPSNLFLTLSLGKKGEH